MILLAIGIGGGIAYFLFTRQYVDEEVVRVHAFQVGVFSNYDNALRVADRNNGIVVKDNDLYRVYVSILSSDDAVLKMMKYYDSIGLKYYLRDINVSKEFLTSELRRRAKAVNFGIIYGISDWGLSEQISSSSKEAKEIITTFYNKYPEVKDYFTSVIQSCRELGYSTTLYGRKRYIPEITSENYNIREFGKRAAMNASIQGTGADIIKIAMIKIDQFLKENHYKSKMVLQIHDELIFRIPEEEKDIVPPLLKEIMENCVNLNVKLKVDGSLAKTWYDAK